MRNKSLQNIHRKKSQLCYIDAHSTAQAVGLFDKRIWRVKDVAEFLDCSQGHVYNLASDEKIPKVKKGKFLYFIPNEILNWILEGDLQ